MAEDSIDRQHAVNGEVEQNGAHAIDTNGNDDHDQKTNGHVDDESAAQAVFKLDIKLPHDPFQTSIMCSITEQVQDIRQSISDQPHCFQYSCFHLEHDGNRINDFVELSDVQGIAQAPNAVLVEDPYTESQARMHFVRIRDLIGAHGNQIDYVRGLQAGRTLHDTIAAEYKDASSQGPSIDAIAQYDFHSTANMSTILPRQESSPPTTIKSMALSHWNPPPYQLRTQGHLLYILVTTLEGDQYHITSHVTGFYVNNSSNHKFDPSPKIIPKPHSAHSLLFLLRQISPAFVTAFKSLQDYNPEKDPLSAYHVSNAIPASPWLVSPESTAIQSHQADITRSQDAFLLSASESAETLRDWNEEFQATKELSQETIHDRVFRERLTSKLFAEYNNAAVKGAIMVARGEVAPLNPTEVPKAQIFVYNNVFYSFGADGVGTFAADGGDEAARVAIAKDARGVKIVNQFDINGLFAPATVVVDYLGKRIVGQGIVPGIFKQREEGENQIDYGGVEGKDIVAEHESFKKPFAELSKALHVKRHPVWDKELVRHDLEGSIETKGFLGTDGRRYALDLYKLTPLDISWLEQYRLPETDGTNEHNYPHRMTLLRPELIEAYWRTKLSNYVLKELELRKAKKTDGVAHTPEPSATTDGKQDSKQNGDTDTDEAKSAEKQDTERVDVSNFDFALNPDVFCGQQPQTELEKREWEKDEQEVRNVCKYLTDEVIPQVIKDIREGDVNFPVDGKSLTTFLHKRGINLRYLGLIAKLTDTKDARLQAMCRLAKQEMMVRAFKHVANHYLADIPAVLANSCISHLLNCLLDTNSDLPKAHLDKAVMAMYPNNSLSFTTVTPESLLREVRREIKVRFALDWDAKVTEGNDKLRVLREICLKLGLQLEGRDYFTAKPHANGTSSPSATISNSSHGEIANGQAATVTSSSKKKRKAHTNHTAPASVTRRERQHMFEPEDVINIIPIVKEAAPRSVLAEEALEAAQISIKQGQKDLGQELLLESLSLHEQIYGILHPEVGRAYYTLSSIYFSLEDKNAALELARKSVIIFERTLGIDHAETLLAYLNLSLFEHNGGNTLLALGYIRHALDLWKIIYGPHHPDSITTINNAAVMLQSIKQYHPSRIWFETSLEICGQISGTQSINTATLLFQYAQSLALDRDPKGAVQRMREAYTIFKKELGEEDRNTKEAGTWLDSLTQNAVSMARHAKDIEARRLLVRSSNTAAAAGGRTTRSVLSTIPQGSRPSASTNGQAGTNVQTDGRSAGVENVSSGKSLDELLKYINAGSGEGKSKSKRKTKNPANRR